MQAPLAGSLQASYLEPAKEVPTPPTSLSNQSSLGNATENSRKMMDTSQVLSATTTSFYGNGPSTLTKAASPPREVTHAPKRMANGEIKSPLTSLPPSPLDCASHGHSRTISSTSRTSQIGELSDNLRTRLSYAMVKVQHGWEGHKFSDLEKTISTRNSPVKSESDQIHYPPNSLHGLPLGRSPNALHPYSPRKTSPKHDQQRQSTIRDSKDIYHANLRPITSISPTDPDATYESFWKQHSSTPHLPQIQRDAPFLAPAADILPRIRSEDSADRQRSSLHINFCNDSAKFPGYLPTTPSHRTAPTKTRTPSQQAAAEKDVVESLLFMSSPGNSQHHHVVRPLESAGSPPQDHATSMAKTLFERDKHLESPTGSRTRKRCSLHESEINQLIEEMPDRSSSDESDLLVRRGS